MKIKILQTLQVKKLKELKMISSRHLKDFKSHKDPLVCRYNKIKLSVICL